MSLTFFGGPGPLSRVTNLANQALNPPPDNPTNPPIVPMANYYLNPQAGNAFDFGGIESLLLLLLAGGAGGIASFLGVSSLGLGSPNTSALQEELA